MVKLYDYLQCPFGQKARIVLAEKQLDYELVPVDLRKNEQFEPAFVELNPFHKVPVLVDEEGPDDPESIVVYDSTTIGEYLEDEYPEPPMLPPAEDAAARARIRSLEDYADLAFVVPAGNYLTEYIKEENGDPERLARAKEELDRAFFVLERELQGGRKYLGGDQFTLADAAFAPRLLLLASRGVELPPETRALRGYIDRLRHRDSVRMLQGV
ncbi:MAG: glutathione S-transferase family protein [Deltaproteobacteria bacterium]